MPQGLATGEGIEPPTWWLEATRSIQLSYPALQDSFCRMTGGSGGSGVTTNFGVVTDLRRLNNRFLPIQRQNASRIHCTSRANVIHF